MRPKVLLLDEPLGALDLKLRQAMQIELKEIQQEVGLTFIYVTHDQEEALTMSDRLAVFNRGRIEQVGSPAEVYERPSTGFVAGFVGVSNVLEGDIAAAIAGEPATRSRSDPRRSRCGTREIAPGPEDCTATGRVAEVVYLGAVTRYIVELDGGGSLVVMQQNLSTSSMEALQVKGQAGAPRVAPRQQPPGRSRGRSDGRVHGPGGGSMRNVPRWLAVGAGSRARGRGVRQRRHRVGVPAARRRSRHTIGTDRGRAEPDRMGGLHGRRDDRGLRELRLGHPVREGHRVRGQREVRGHLRRDVQPDDEPSRSVRRRVGIG